MKEEKKQEKNKLSEIPTNTFLGMIFEALEKDSTPISELILFKQEMLRRNFNAPFAFLVFASMKNNEELSKKELNDLSKQLNYFRKIATMKKYALFSARIAIASKKIAELSKKNNYDDLNKFLPITGNHLKSIFASGISGVEIYKELLEKIKQSGPYEDATDYTVEGNNYTFRKTLLNSKSIKLIEGEKIISKKKTAIIRPLFKSSFVAKSILSAIIGYANEVIKNNFEEEDKVLLRYNAIIKDFGYSNYSNVSFFLDKNKELCKTLEKENFAENGKLKEDLVQTLKQRRELIKQKMIKLCSLMLVIPITKHYLLKNKGERLSNPIFPSMPVNPTKEQISFFKIIEKETGFDLIELLKNKFELEDYGENSKISEGLLASMKGINASALFFKKTEDEIKSSLEYLEKIKSGKGRDFLERIKKK